jgi:hypothetical protein
VLSLLKLLLIRDSDDALLLDKKFVLLVPFGDNFEESDIEESDVEEVESLLRTKPESYVASNELLELLQLPVNEERCLYRCLWALLTGFSGFKLDSLDRSEVVTNRVCLFSLIGKDFQLNPSSEVED